VLGVEIFFRQRIVWRLPRFPVVHRKQERQGTLSEAIKITWLAVEAKARPILIGCDFAIVSARVEAL
jgi:hypothetical protein